MSSVLERPARAAGGSPQSVERIFAVLNALAASQEAMGLSELARVLGAPKTSLVGLLAGMVDGDFLQREPNGGYRLGPRMFALSMRVVGRLNLTVLARPVLEWLEEQTGETALLGALAPSGDTAMYIDKVESRSALRYTVSLGEHRELYCTAIGKLLLAYMPEAAQREYLETHALKRFAQATVTDRRMLLKEIADSREAGFFHTRGERVEGASAFAVPVFGFPGAMPFGVVVAGPSERMDRNEALHVARLREAATRLGLSLTSSA